ncbi:MAG TPA: hypothetical protein VGH58_01620 [Solirubrobacterales bacterium]|jgi:hypothetical protein
MSRGTQTITTRRALCAAALCLSALLGAPSLAQAASPQWSVSLSANPSSFAAGSNGNATEGPAYLIIATNKGDGDTTSPYTITDVLPADVTPISGEVSGKAAFEVRDAEGNVEKVESKPLSCQVSGQEVSCTGTDVLAPGRSAEVIAPIDVATGISGKSLLNEATVQGGGASPAQAKLRTAVGLPAWRISPTPAPSNLKAGASGLLIINATNVGAATTSGPVTLTFNLGPELSPTLGAIQVPEGSPCSVAGQSVTCTFEGHIYPGHFLGAIVEIEADSGASGPQLNEVTIEGGNATPVTIPDPVEVSSALPPFGFLPGESGFSAPLSSAEGSAVTQAGSHPHQLTVEMSFPTWKLTQTRLTSVEQLHDAVVDLPPGEIVNPNSTAERCTEAELIVDNCPEGSQIGNTTTVTGFLTETLSLDSPMYNMVPPRGTPSSFGFDAGGFGVFIHIIGSLRSDGDYGLSGNSREILAPNTNPVLGVRFAFWGDPSNSGHDAMRGLCAFRTGTYCPAEEESKTALLTAPVQCSGQPTVTRGRIDSWQAPHVVKTGAYESADLAGTPVAVNGCNQLQYEPSVEASPTTTLADSPSGLNVDIRQPTNEDPGGISPAMMRNLRLALPQGMSVNPSSADGLGACTEAQAHVHTLIVAECPGDSKLGSAEVVTTLLDHPLTGGLYLAQPFHNPSNSLIGLYLAIDDPVSGIVSNLAGKVIADPVTGQLTTVFEDNPQLPLEDIKTHLFTGPRAALRTPAACGAYASKADLTPWSAPQTPVAHLSDPFEIQANPNGGTCPAQGQPLPNTPAFTAGTISPQAGEYTPFLFKLTRKDDTAEPVRVDTTLPAGLTAKLAGVPYCPESAIARATSRSNPNEGIIERDDPSCPAASKVGTIDVATGAGLTPLHTQGNVYLSGPYKGAPISLAIITPAIAGPFDLGTVVARVALNVDPETAKVTAVSDPLPSILYGIPLDIRSIAFQMDRPEFTLNPTSCDPMSIGGEMQTATGGTSPLLVPFQVGGCSALGFKPKLAIRLEGGTTRGAHPALSATLTYPKTGKYANVKVAQVTLPHSEFLDQAHIGTVCTRVQFAADQCPAKSIYGKATATTPLLSNPLSGPVYLRSSSHELPDLVVDLHGQVDVVLDGRIDSVNGGIRNTFEAAPDAPVTKFTLQMQGGKKGLLVNSRNLCRHPDANKATVLMEAQNGKVHDTTPALANSCKKAKKHKHKAKSKR